MNVSQNPFKEEFDGNLQNIEVIAPELIEEFHNNTYESPFSEDNGPKSIFEDYFVFERKDEIDKITSGSNKRPKVKWDSKRFDIEFVPLVTEDDSEPIITPVVDEDVHKDVSPISSPYNADPNGNTKGELVGESPEERDKSINNSDNQAKNGRTDKNEADLVMPKLSEVMETLGGQKEISLPIESSKRRRTNKFNERIKLFFLKFSKSYQGTQRPARTKDKSSDVNFKSFNVFEDLFRTCDLDKKLILMDEIMGVGDERDIDFVEELLNDSEVKIVKKARKVLKMLEHKLAKENEVLEAAPAIIIPIQEEMDQRYHIDGTVLLEYSLLLDEMEIEPPKNPNIFEVGFELSEQVPLDNPNPSEGQNNELNL